MGIVQKSGRTMLTMKWTKSTLVALVGLGLATEASAFCQHFSHENGQGGYHFETEANLSGVKSVSVSAGDHVDSVKLHFFDRKTVHAGGSGGRTRKFHFPPSDCITKVSIWASRGTNALQFHTQNGRDSPVFGDQYCDSCNEPTVLIAPPGDELVGMHGRADSLVDKIVFDWGCCVEATEKRKLKRHKSLKNILTSMKKEGLTLDNEELEQIADLRSTD